MTKISSCSSISFKNLENKDRKMLNQKMSKIFEVLTKAFSQYKVDEIFLSFNGGKDCTVLLDIVKKFLNENYSLESKKLRIIYIQPENSFKEVEDFIDKCEVTYNIKIERMPGKLKNILENICLNSPNLKAVMMGSRRTDPFCENLDFMQPTDSNWPPLMRINPLLDWTCTDVWNYILSEKIPYCVLYDEGMTSIGDQTNTKKNPHLKDVNPVTKEISYRKAYELLDDSLERAGRI